MSITSIIVAWLFLMVGYLLLWKFRDDRLHGKNFFNFGDYNFLVASLTALGICWVAFSLSSPEPHFDNPEKQLEFARETHQPRLATDAVWKKIDAGTATIDDHFALVENHFDQLNGSFTSPDIPAYNRESSKIYNYYTDLCEKKNAPEDNDIGNLMLALDYIETSNAEDLDVAAFHLRQVENRQLKYLNYAEGRLLLYQVGTNEAESYFEEEIRLNGYKKGAWEELAMIYSVTKQDEKLKALADSSESRDAVPVNYRYKFYFLSGDLVSFYKLKFKTMIAELSLWGILGDILILFTWLFFLRTLSFLSPVKWKHFFLAVGIGSLLAMLSWLLYEFYHHVLHFWNNGGIKNDLLFSFFGIGFIEELVKLLPFLLLLRFTKIIKRPVDYLLIASAVGLGFAFFENLLYFSQYGLDVIHSRALTASVSHMASSAVVAYGFVLWKFHYPKKSWIVPLFFLFAVLAHGFYDFWLLNNKVAGFAIVTLFFFLSEILVYVSFINNALNQSAVGAGSAKELSLNTQKLASFIAGSLILVFLLEYIGSAITYGTAVGNQTLLNSFFSGGYLVFFLSVRLSNIDIIPGEWMKIEFFSGILPSDILGGTKKINQNSVVGLTLDFVMDPETSALAMQMPFRGYVRKRLRMKGFSGWFVIELEKPVVANGTETKLIYIRAKNPGELISHDEETTVGVFVRMQQEGKLNLVFYDWAVVR